MEEKWGIGDCVYVQCIDEFSKLELSSISELTKDRILRAFLIGWGVMQRQLGYVGIEKVFEKIKEPKFVAKVLPFRKLKLESSENLSSSRKQIVDLFDEVANIGFRSGAGNPKRAGSTTASKVLHLCCPDLFVMWDAGIRGKVYKKTTGDGADYFEFLSEMKKLLKELEPTIKELEKEYDKRATRLIDEYNWYKAHHSEK